MLHFGVTDSIVLLSSNVMCLMVVLNLLTVLLWYDFAGAVRYILLPVVSVLVF